MAVNFSDAPQMYRWKDPTLPPTMPALAVFFVQEAHVNSTVTRETGVQTYDNVLVAYIAPMGMPKSNVAQEIERTLPDGKIVVNTMQAHKYAEQVKLFKAGLGAETQGTPLRDLVGMTPATVMNLRAKGVHTVEMLAEMPDGSAAEMMGFYDLRERARKHIEAREKNAPTVRLEQELAVRDSTIQSQQRQIDELRALIEDKTKTKKAA